MEESGMFAGDGNRCYKPVVMGVSESQLQLSWVREDLKGSVRLGECDSSSSG